MTAAALYAVSACCLSSGAQLPSLRSSATLLLVVFVPPRAYSRPVRALELCLWSGTGLAEEASSKQACLFVVSGMNKTTPAAPSQGGTVRDVISS